MKIFSVALIILIFSLGSFATEFKDCTKLKSKCFDLKNNPAKPFVMRANTKKKRGLASAQKVTKKVAVLVHGLTDSPYTFKDIALFLNRQGYTVYGVLLPGHGDKPEDLLSVRNTEWLREVWNTLKQALFETKADKALLVGFSLGGVLVTEIAEQPQWKKKISGLILQVPAFQIKNQVGQVTCDMGIAEYIETWVERRPSSVVEYGKTATHSVCELVTLADRVRAHIKRVTAPVMITLTDYDSELDNQKILESISQMQSQVKDVFYLRKSYSDLDMPGIHFTQVVVPTVKHQDVNYESDPIMNRKNPAYDQMIDEMKDFLEENKI